MKHPAIGEIVVVARAGHRARPPERMLVQTRTLSHHAGSAMNDRVRLPPLAFDAAADAGGGARAPGRRTDAPLRDRQLRRGSGRCCRCAPRHRRPIPSKIRTGSVAPTPTSTRRCWRSAVDRRRSARPPPARPGALDAADPRVGDRTRTAMTISTSTRRRPLHISDRHQPGGRLPPNGTLVMLARRGGRLRPANPHLGRDQAPPSCLHLVIDAIVSPWLRELLERARRTAGSRKPSGSPSRASVAGNREAGSRKPAPGADQRGRRRDRLQLARVLGDVRGSPSRSSKIQIARRQDGAHRDDDDPPR